MRSTGGKKTENAENQTEAEAIELKTQLREVVSLPLKPSDFARALAFTHELSTMYSRKLTTYVKVKERSFEVPPQMLTKLADIISSYGGLKELDYLSLFARGELVANFDFSYREFRIRAKDRQLLERLEKLWKGILPKQK